MHFLVHGSVHPDALAAMKKLDHTCHSTLELSADTDAPVELADSPKDLCQLLTKKQWQLLTTDTDFIQRLYEEHVEFPGIIVLILDDPDILKDHAPAIERLFERYKRLTPRRLYTITPSRVKIRQLPGANQG